MSEKLLKVDIPNSNNRTYPRAVIQEALDRNAEAPLMVSLGVQENDTVEIDMARVVGVMTNLQIDPEGYLVGDYLRLDLPAAQDFDKLSNMVFRPVGFGRADECGNITEYTFRYICVLPQPLAAAL